LFNFDIFYSNSGGEVVGKDSGVSSVVQKEDFQISGASDQESFESLSVVEFGDLI
jgi:hypothetical protein